MLFAQNPLEHVLDTKDWHFFESIPALHGFHIPGGLTKYMIIEVIAAALICAIFIPLARKIKNGESPRGLFWNASGGLVPFTPGNVAKPYIGHEADHSLHYLWTVFLFVFFCNLLGMVPF